jgi:tRNA uridine 5-carboxymethylaminomethyl modification enzyme
MHSLENKNFDIIIVGGGHAGIEAAHMASEFELKVGLISLPKVKLGSMPCNPAIGGVGKGQVVREIDALGGIMGYLADLGAIQYRILNESKGFAVQSPRAQIDKELYADNATDFLSKKLRLTIIRDELKSISSLNEGGNSFQLEIGDGIQLFSKKVIITAGTFLGGELHCGEKIVTGGRVGVQSSGALSKIFQGLQEKALRFKTGTPPRLKHSTINYDVMERQESDAKVRNFHALNEPYRRMVNQICCHITHTNQNTIDIIAANREKSPIFNGQIVARGPRYCPSIEDKVARYPERYSHHVFIEPEGLNSDLIYPNGLSSSLPEEVQEKFIRSIPGLEKAEIEIPGYAVCYDVLDTTLLKRTLECKSFAGLYFAGQVNGTSGYEEAAGQGLMAGINAALSLTSKTEMILERKDSYIGVMIDDLVGNPRDEPYRLFTARSENRLYIRDDNALLRMYKYRKLLRLSQKLDQYLDQFGDEVSALRNICIEEKMRGPGHSVDKIALHLKQAENPVQELAALCEREGIKFLPGVEETVAISLKYDGYIKRSEVENEKIHHLEMRQIQWEKWIKSPNISNECRQRIEKVQPATFGQLKRIEGIRPATLAVVAGNFS